jgi:hypothetical protein
VEAERGAERPVILWKSSRGALKTPRFGENGMQSRTAFALWKSERGSLKNFRVSAEAGRIEPAAYMTRSLNQRASKLVDLVEAECKAEVLRSVQIEPVSLKN